jgi:hypothetical protein
MSTITIDDKEYQVDDFTEKQKKAYNELLLAKSEMERMEYTYLLLQSRAASLVSVLKEEPTDG